MKSIIYVILLLISVETFSQSEAEVQKTIETFFEGFHKQDSTLLNQVVYKDVTLQTIATNREGKTILVFNIQKGKGKSEVEKLKKTLHLLTQK